MTQSLSNLRVYDNGGNTYDRYTALFLDLPDYPEGNYHGVAMSHDPLSPVGVCLTIVNTPGGHLGKRIELADLPVKCQEVVKQYF